MGILIQTGLDKVLTVGADSIRVQARSAAASGPSPLLTDLISYWKMDEASGTRADSVLASANDLTDNNTVGAAAGKIGNAGDFEVGSQESLSRADNASLSTGDIDFTIAGWMYFESFSGGGNTLVAKWNTGENEYLLFYNNVDHSPNDRFCFAVSNDGAAAAVLDGTTFGAASTSTWYFVVAWHDATANTINLQINNGTVDSAAHTTGVRDGAAAFEMGSLAGGAAYWMDGLIDEVGFWKRVLTVGERTNLYNAGAGLTYPF